MYIVQGPMSVKTALNEYVISAGDSAFINTNVLHYQKPLGSAKVITLNQVLQPSEFKKIMGMTALKYREKVPLPKKSDQLLISVFTSLSPS